MVTVRMNWWEMDKNALQIFAELTIPVSGTLEVNKHQFLLSLMMCSNLLINLHTMHYIDFYHFSSTTPFRKKTAFFDYLLRKI